LFLFFCSWSHPIYGASHRIYEVIRGRVHFSSNAPQELIKASSTSLSGILDVDKRIFVFKIGSRSFNGFNSPLQREHFNENYLESHLFPESTFSGKIIESVDLKKDGVYKVRAKGKLTIHGVAQERIIYVLIRRSAGIIKAEADFTVNLKAHDIKVPRIVSEKLAQEIEVEVQVELHPQQP